jgi:hypothetical protein
VVVEGLSEVTREGRDETREGRKAEKGEKTRILSGCSELCQHKYFTQ